MSCVILALAAATANVAASADTPTGTPTDTSTASTAASASAETASSWWQEKLVDPEDRKLDASGFLASAYGFIPIGSIITDPAVGYGASLGLIFIRPNETRDGHPDPPDMSAAGGFATENGSWGAGLGDSSVWRDGKVKTLAGAFDVAANLQFFGEAGHTSDVPLDYSLRTWGAMTEVSMRTREPHTWAGLRYVFANVKVAFDISHIVPGVDPNEHEQTLSGLTPVLKYDTRDNIFTPTKGVYAESAVEVFNSVLGSDRNLEIVSLAGMWFRPVTDTLTLGMKGDLRASFDDVPFYLRPYVQLRGIQSLGLQAQNIADLELELRWQRWRRYSLVAFAGGGTGWSRDRENSERSVATGGIGIRYLAARRFGLHMGFDVGFGPDEPIFYFQFGSAWFHP